MVCPKNVRMWNEFDCIIMYWQNRTSYFLFWQWVTFLIIALEKMYHNLPKCYSALYLPRTLIHSVRKHAEFIYCIQEHCLGLTFSPSLYLSLSPTKSQLGLQYNELHLCWIQASNLKFSKKCNLLQTKTSVEMKTRERERVRDEDTELIIWSSSSPYWFPIAEYQVFGPLSSSSTRPDTGVMTQPRPGGERPGLGSEGEAPPWSAQPEIN